jgi:sugar lactone lactonase YvrE
LTTLRNALPVIALAVLSLAVAACKGPGASVAPGGFPTCSPCGTPHAQYVVVANVITPSLLTFNLGETKTLNSGNLTPTYKNTSTHLSQPFFIFNDFNSNLWAAEFSGASLTWFSVSATGGSPTSHSISGSSTTLGCPTGVYISPHGTIYVADPCSLQGYPTIDEFAAGSSGNVAPVSWIGGATTTLSFPQGISIDSKGNLWVIDTFGPWIDEFSSSLVSGQNNVAPAGKITSSALVEPDEIYIDYQSHIWVGDLDGGASFTPAVSEPALYEFNGAAGTQNAPLCTIAGSNTGITSTTGQVSVAVDNGGYVYAVDAESPQVSIFDPGQCGNVTPAYTIGGANTSLTYPAAILVYSTGNDY